MKSSAKLLQFTGFARCVVQIIFARMKSVIFDLGGVLLDLDYQKTIDAFGRLGLERAAEAFSKYSQDELFKRLERGEVDTDEFLDALDSKMGGPGHAPILESWCAMLGSMPEEKFLLLQELGEHLDIYLLSNTNELHRRHFEAVLDEQYGRGAFLDLFDGVGYSHELGFRKPEPEIFRRFVDMHDIDPATTLFIDDTEVNVQGGLDAGIPSVHYPIGTSLRELIDGWSERG